MKSEETNILELEFDQSLCELGKLWENYPTDKHLGDPEYNEWLDSSMYHANRLLGIGRELISRRKWRK